MYTVYCDRIVDYWIPSSKKDCMIWLAGHKGYDVAVLSRMKADQVFAIYHKIRRG